MLCPVKLRAEKEKKRGREIPWQGIFLPFLRHIGLAGLHYLYINGNPCYASEEILHNCEVIAGVKLPQTFFMGFRKKDITYNEADMMFAAG